MKHLLLSSLIIASASFVGCSDDDAEVIEIAGLWDNNFGSQEDINSTQWGTAAVVYFDNQNNFAITQNAADAEFSPSLFNKLVWTEVVNQETWYCTIDFGKDTAEDAENTVNVADSSDLDDMGCGGFSWTKLVPVAQ